MAKIVFLAHNIYGVGGTVRTLVNLANELSKKHEIVIASVYKRVDSPSFKINRSVNLVPLVDTRPGSSDNSHPESHLPSLEISSFEELYNQYSRLSDIRLKDFLTTLECDVIISSRPGLAIMMSKFAKSSIIKVAQEHTSASMLAPQLIEDMRSAYKNIDEVTTVTHYERELFERLYHGLDVRVTCIPNSFNDSNLGVSNQKNKLIVAAGRINRGKRFELLIHAFGILKDDFPDWKVRIYGDGSERASLKYLIQKLGLPNHIQFMGAHGDMAGEWRKGSIAVSTSDAESFGMTIIEAMNAGLAVLSTDCPVGPREIIDNEVDGILTPVGDLTALTHNLRRLISSAELRNSLSSAAIEKSKNYSSKSIGAQYEKLLNISALNLDAINENSDRNSRALSQSALEIVSLSGNEVQISLMLPRSFMNILPKISFYSQTKKSKSFNVRLKRILSENNADTFRSIIPAEFFNTDAIWDTKISLIGRKIKYDSINIDSSILINRNFSESPNGFAHIIPFASREGELRVRSWRRRRHAELQSIGQSGSHAIIDVESLESRSEIIDAVLIRRGTLKKKVVVPIESRGKDSVRVIVDLSVIADLAIDIHEDWDLFLRESGKRLRVAKIVDDVVAKKHIYSFPAWNTDEYSSQDQLEARIAVRPYLSVRNDLSFSVKSRKY